MKTRSAIFKRTTMTLLAGFGILISFASSGMELLQLQQIRGIAATNVPDRVLAVAAQGGIYQIAKDGPHKSGNQNWALFSMDRSQDGTLYASGQLLTGGTSQLIRSTDNGEHWAVFSKLKDQAAKFHFLSASPADNLTLYGHSDAIQVSHDGGKTWTPTGQLPKDAYTMEASSVDKNSLYAGTKNGLFRSQDQGKTWANYGNINIPVTAIFSENGQISLYGGGKGVMTFAETAPEKATSYNRLGGRYITYFTRSKGKLWGIDQFNTLWLQSADNTWHYYQQPKLRGQSARNGKKLYNQYCESCHGQYGVGESYSEASMTDKDYRRAPALDWTMHAWHHTDENLIDTIQNSFTQQQVKDTKMPAWKGILSVNQTEDIIAYFKSFWHQRELGCQGPRHMSPECQKR